MPPSPGLMYVALISIHGLIRGKNPELGRDADTGGQTLYVLELARSLVKLPEVNRVDLITRLVDDPTVSPEYAQPIEDLGNGARIVRIQAGPSGYVAKEQLWNSLDTFADSVLTYFRDNELRPSLIHGHYADAGYVGARLANVLGVPLIFTGHSLGRVKRRRLVAGGLSAVDVERRYNIARRVEAEELTLATAERVITSTFQEIDEQYGLYDHYQPEQMRVIPPGTDLTRFSPPKGDEFHSPLFNEVARFLQKPEKPIILALSRPDRRKNITALIDAYGQSSELQKIANLLIVAGNRKDIDDLDEGAQEVFHELLVAIDRYDLYGKAAMPKRHQRIDVPQFYRIAAASGGVFVNPALTEPFGLTLIEAAACGLPIVATEDGGPCDIIGNCHNGTLIDPLDSGTIVTALLEVLRDKSLWKQRSDAGIQGVREHYTWDSHASRYLDVIKPIIARVELLERKKPAKRPAIYGDRAIFSDLDQNLLGDPASLLELMVILRRYRKCTQFGIATGRRLDSALKIMKQFGIQEPDILLTSSGTEIYYAPKLSADAFWQQHIDYHWTPHVVRRVLSDIPGITLQPKSEQSRFKISYYIDRSKAPTLDEITSLLHREEQAVNVTLAFGQYLDITPIRASKGLALRYVADRWQIPLERIFVAGGSGADEDMMRGNTLAAVVANRHHEELSQLSNQERIFFAEKTYASGILEALEHYRFFEGCAAGTAL